MKGFAIQGVLYTCNKFSQNITRQLHVPVFIIMYALVQDSAAGNTHLKSDVIALNYHICSENEASYITSSITHNMM